MSGADILALAQQYLTPARGHQLLEMLGVAALIGKVIPWLLAWGIPASIKAADWLFALAMKVPLLRQLILWYAPQIIAFLRALRDAIVQIIGTFEGELEKDIEQAEETPPGGKPNGQTTGPAPAGGAPQTQATPPPTGQ